MLYELTNLAQKAFTAMENTYTVVSNMAAQSLYGTYNPGRASTFRQGTAASNMSAVTAAVPGGVPVSDDGRAEGGGVASGDLMLVFSSDANMHSVTVVGADGQLRDPDPPCHQHERQDAHVRIRKTLFGATSRSAAMRTTWRRRNFAQESRD